MKPVIIQAAITGSIATIEHNPNVPMTLAQNIDAGLTAWRAGASVLHLHAREEDGTPTQDVGRFQALVEGLRAAGCDAVLNLSTGSAGGRSDGAERYACLTLEPELGSLDCGSVNMGERVFSNPERFLRDMAREFLERNVKPEIECFEAGHVENALRLREAGLLEDPIHFQFVLGVRGGAPASLAQLAHLRAMLPPGATWSACGVGRHQLPLNLLSLASDGHVRTGLEDNAYFRAGERAESNAQLVARVVRIAGEIGRPVATPEQARQLLSLRSPV